MDKNVKEDEAFSVERRALLTAMTKYGARAAGASVIVLSASEAVKAQANSNATTNACEKSGGRATFCR